MTWLEFKNKAEILGVKDEDEIWYIDISFSDHFKIERDEHLGVSIS